MVLSRYCSLDGSGIVFQHILLGRAIRLRTYGDEGRMIALLDRLGNQRKAGNLLPVVKPTYNLWFVLR